MVIKVYTRDRVIWNLNKVIISLCSAMNKNVEITIDLNNEGPDCHDIQLYDIIDRCAREFSYDIGKITLITCNTLENHDVIKVKSSLSFHLATREVYLHSDYDIKKIPHGLKHFGHFVGRSNAPRLMLSVHLEKHHANKTISSYHYDPAGDYHKDQTGIESLINDYQITDITEYAKFLSECPKKLFDEDFRFSKDQTGDHYEQLLRSEKGEFVKQYQKFFVEICSESYFNGNTFFVTEKTFRPILLKTPFIVQGPTGFLKNLRNLGFKTFSQWWDEGYDEDPVSWSVREITKVIDYLSLKSQDEIQNMLTDMQHTLEHNRNLLIELTNETKHRDLTYIF